MKFKLWYPVKPRLPNEAGLVPHLLGQRFGQNGAWYRENGINVKGHTGIDMGAGMDEVIRAAHDGTVHYAGSDSLEGYGVTVRTDNTFEYKGKEVYYRTIYWHLKMEIPVKVGQKVKTGDILGYSGNTGFSTGPHLHFGLKPMRKINNWTWINIEKDNGYFGAIDPMPYFTTYFAQDKTKVLSIYNKILDVLRELLRMKRG